MNDIAKEINRIMAEIRTLQNAIDNSYSKEGTNRIIVDAAIKNADCACESLELTKVLCSTVEDHAQKRAETDRFYTALKEELGN